MATASEIKITEAYIGLLGRAPDPLGLDYWVGEYDKKVAAGGNADVILKKIMNDFTLSDEWDNGLGANVTKTTVNGVTTLSYTKTQADTVVKGIYGNLFERPAPSDAEVKYWSDQLQDGTVTASEMAVLIILGAGDDGTDHDVLGYKTEAATYYVETIATSDYNDTQATTAVDAVQGPVTLLASQLATDAIATGEGTTKTLTTATDTIVMTGGDDVITGTSDTMGAADSVADKSAADNDSLTITGDGDVTFGTVTNVENIILSLSKVTGAGLTVAADKASGGTIAIDVDPTVKVEGVDVAGETVVDVTDLASNLTTTDVTALTVSLDPAAALSISADADAASVTVTNIDDNDVTITVANNDSTVLLDGTAGAGANDSASVSAVGKSAISLNTAQAVEEVTLSGNGGAVVYTVTNAVGADTTYSVAGDQDVTLSGTAAMFTTAKFTDSSTAGDVSVAITDGESADLWKFGALSGGVNVAGNTAGADALVVAGGNTVKISADQVAALTIDANDTATTTAMTLDIDNDVAGLVSTDIESLTIDAGNDALSVGGALNFATAAVTYVGLGDLSGATDIDTLSLGMTTGGLAATTVDATTGSLTITATNDVAVTGAMTANDTVTITADDITLDSVAQVTANGTSSLVLTATNDVTVGGVTDFNDITLTGDAVIVSAQMDADNDVVMTATNEVNLTDAVISDKGDITISGSFVDATAITATVGDISLTATNDSREAGAQADITTVQATAGDVTLSNGDFDIATTLKAGKQITISGDTQVSVDGGTTTAGDAIIITTNNDVDLGTVDAPSMTSVSTADITATFTSAAGLKATTVTTSGGNDVLNLNDADAVFTVSTGDNSGTETITVTLAEDESSVNSGAGADTVDVVDATILGLDVTTGAGDDTVIIANADQGATVAMGAGSADKLKLKATGTYDDLAFSDIEELDISTAVGQEVTMSWEQLSGNDSTFKLTGSQATDKLILTATSTANTTGDTIDLTGIEANVLGEATISATGDDGNDTITGSTELVNTLVGGAGVDIITGGELGDSITGGDDNDTMTGGAGVDTFVSDSADGGVDTILDFGLGSQVDNIDVTATSAVNVTVVADYEDTDAGDIDNAATNADLVFKVNNGIDFSADTSTPTNGMTITAAGNTSGSTLKGGGLADIITGGAGIDTLTGNAGIDVIVGGAGADIISGGDGADIITGGAGNDIITLGAGVDVVNLASGSADTIADLVEGDAGDVLKGLDAIATGDGFSKIGAAGALDFGDKGVFVAGFNVATADATMTAAELETALVTGFGSIAAGESAIALVSTDFDGDETVYVYSMTSDDGDDIDSVELLAVLSANEADNYTAANFDGIG